MVAAAPSVAGASIMRATIPGLQPSSLSSMIWPSMDMELECECRRLSGKTISLLRIVSLTLVILNEVALLWYMCVGRSAILPIVLIVCIILATLALLQCGIAASGELQKIRCLFLSTPYASSQDFSRLIQQHRAWHQIYHSYIPPSLKTTSHQTAIKMGHGCSRGLCSTSQSPPPFAPVISLLLIVPGLPVG